MKLSPDDAAAFPPPEGPAAPSFPGSPGRRRPEDSPMPQQTRDGHDSVQAAPDETTRLAGGPSAVPPPATGTQGQSARLGHPPVPAAAETAFSGEPDDTRPVSREWLKTAAAPEQPAAEDWSTQELSGYDEAPPAPIDAEEPSVDVTTLLPADVDDDGPGTPGPPSADDDQGRNDGGPRRPW